MINSRRKAWEALGELIGGLGADTVRGVVVVEVPCDRPPWVNSGLALEPGDHVTTFAIGSTVVAGTGISLGPSFQLWFRIGDDGEIFRGTRDSHTFLADRRGALQIASYFPGEWGTRTGALGVPAGIYSMVQGSFSVMIVLWKGEALRGLHQLAGGGEPSGLVASEIDRLTDPVLPPDGWYYKWFIGPAEIFRAVEIPGHRNAISCRTQGDCGLLLRDVTLPLEPGVRLGWSWSVETLPSAVSENTLLTHDYMSIAVEFGDGQDLTYFWSADLSAGTSFRCPIPQWDRRETHVALRSGADHLGEWRREERDVYADYVQYIGGPAGTQIVRIWLIALSLFQRQPGISAFADITLTAPTGATLSI